MPRIATTVKQFADGLQELVKRGLGDEVLWVGDEPLEVGIYIGWTTDKVTVLCKTKSQHLFAATTKTPED